MTNAQATGVTSTNMADSASDDTAVSPTAAASVAVTAYSAEPAADDEPEPDDERLMRITMKNTQLTLASLTAAAVILAPAAHADPASNAICRLLAAGNTPSGLENSVTVRQVLGPDATAADARVYIRSVVAGQCPQYLWRW